MNFETWVYAAFSAAVIGLAVDHFRVRSELSGAKVDLANLRTHVAEHYIRGPEMERLEKAIAEQGAQLQQLVALVHELKGALHQARG